MYFNYKPWKVCHYEVPRSNLTVGQDCFIPCSDEHSGTMFIARNEAISKIFNNKHRISITEVSGMKKLSMDELNRKSAEEFKKAPKLPIVIVLDNVRSMNNVGSVFRTADAFLLHNIYLCGVTAKPPHREIQKTALGATETVEWKYFETTMEAINSLKSDGYKIYAVEQADKSIMLDKFRPASSNIALVFGNEITGVKQTVIDICDACIEIPQYGTKHSLNLAVSAGIVVWEVVNKLP
jgi:23S rRNA (guanosine2251-2'-O)-methyltransferase